MSEPRTILIINFHSAQNAGDLALLHAAIEQLRGQFQAASFIVAANDPDIALETRLRAHVIPSIGRQIGFTSHSFAVFQVLSAAWLILLGFLAWLRVPFHQSRWLPKHWRELVTPFEQADIVVSCPGNHFFSMGRIGWPLIVSALPVYLALCFRKQLYILPQSLGPFKRSWEAVLMRSLYARARLVFVREPVSLRLAQSLGLPSDRLCSSPDLAFGFPSSSAEVANQWLARTPGSTAPITIGVTVISKMVRTLDAAEMESYYHSLAEALSRVIQTHSARVFFFAQVTGPAENEDDRRPNHLVASQIVAEPGQVTLIDEPLPPEALEACYGQMDLFIASRLHSGIFALNRHVPTLFIGYLTKTAGVLDGLGLQPWLIPLPEVTPDRLYEKIVQMIEVRQDIRTKLDQVIPLQVAQARQVGYQLAEDYRHATA